LRFIADNFPESVGVEPRPSYGLDQMQVAQEGRGLLAEVREGAQVGDAYFMWMTCDSEPDRAVLRKRLENYWAKHAVAVRPPWFVDSRWPSMEGSERVVHRWISKIAEAFGWKSRR